MNICVYGASSSTIANHISIPRRNWEKMAKRGHNLVYGAGALGLAWVQLRAAF